MALKQKLNTINVEIISKIRASPPKISNHLNVMTSNIHKISNKNGIPASPTL